MVAIEGCSYIAKTITCSWALSLHNSKSLLRIAVIIYTGREYTNAVLPSMGMLTCVTNGYIVFMYNGGQIYRIHFYSSTDWYIIVTAEFITEKIVIVTLACELVNFIY